MAYLHVRSDGGTLFPKDRCIVAEDGTHIAYTVRGRGPVTVVLCAGFCCPDNFWRYLVPSLARRYRVLVWNYRGIGASGLPRQPGARGRGLRPGDFAIERTAADLEQILAHEGMDDVVLLGHSMGVQVCLEAYRRIAPRVRALVAVTGPYGSPLRTLYNSTLPLRLFPVAKQLVRLIPGHALPLWRALFATDVPHRGAILLGALSPACAPEDMRPYFDHMASLDPLVMLKMAEAMQEHSAEDVLPDVSCPALVLVGEKDNFTPAWLGKVMVSRMPDAELFVIPGGSHGAIVEYPKVVNRAILDFLKRRVAGAEPASSSRARS